MLPAAYVPFVISATTLTLIGVSFGLYGSYLKQKIKSSVR